jgi:hypothetical protein
MGDEQLSLFAIPDSPTFLKAPKHDPYWDEITREPENTVLTAKNDDVGTNFAVRTRNRGDGTGRIQWRTITRKSGKQYKEAWYDWQVYEKDKRIYRSRYIPKRLLPQIQALEAKKVPVSKILEVLGVKSTDE